MRPSLICALTAAVNDCAHLRVTTVLSFSNMALSCLRREVKWEHMQGGSVGKKCVKDQEHV